MSVAAVSMTRDTICNVTLIGTILGDSVWTLYGFNLHIINALVTKSKFFLMSDDNKANIYLVNILSSSFGQLQTSGRFHITIVNCYLDGNTRGTSTLVDIVDCTLNIEKFIFFNHRKYDKGPAIINAVNSYVSMVNVNIYKNYALNGLIWASKSSKLYIKKSNFNGNGMFLWTSSVLILKHNSILFLSKCKCQNNAALYGPCVHASDNVTIIAKKSTFYYNNALRGGAVYWKNIFNMNRSDINETKSHHKIDVNGEDVRERNLRRCRAKVVFQECVFYQHIAFTGGVLFMEGSSVEVYVIQCFFIGNKGRKVGGSIFLQGD